MNREAISELTKEFTLLCNHTLAKLADDHTQSYSELIGQWRILHSAYLEAVTINLQQWTDKYDLAAVGRYYSDQIEADLITAEIVDNNTGKLYRRQLPVKYFETGNGVVLSGETIEGNISEITFLSEAALAKLNDLFGKGPDAPHCKK
jgi:hypothetical protein